MTAFESITALELVTVTGGEDAGTFGPGAGPNRTKAQGQLSVDTPVGLKVSGTGTYESAQSNYATCMSSQPKGTSGADMAKNCNPLAGTPGN